MEYYAKVRLKLHWGFSVSVPLAAKAKPSFFLPPPSTLKGALSFSKYRGVDTVGGRSPASEFEDVLAFARFSDDTVASYSEDVVRNVVLLFQRPERREDRTYWFNIVPTGKVLSPAGEIVSVFVTNKFTKKELEDMGWSIMRLGSKEGLVSVEEVETGEAKAVSGKVSTKYYFPATAAVEESHTPKLVYAEFWEGGFEYGKEGKRVRYAVPLQRFPMKSIEVTVNSRKAYEVGGEYVVVA
ncbi:type I-A CRISPR-associated protein Cas5 [Metallosphaera tengchongensis]|uniref:Type I-A CRISPR-associated protein Cas5 n=1 Tax=Metallosphaera tengchongensis TaxID=1532350 RepID=A0A6N0NXX5_9CREN|nr:type I-A CRISPR-associated protein Cas5a [Metallosphaera tengchongensis]QKR00723.1 type I-A CRISPR-associated protein Cas5 [Metallosphaera tengchongensis]